MCVWGARSSASSPASRGRMPTTRATSSHRACVGFWPGRSRRRPRRCWSTPSGTRRSPSRWRSRPWRRGRRGRWAAAHAVLVGRVHGRRAGGAPAPAQGRGAHAVPLRVGARAGAGRRAGRSSRVGAQGRTPPMVAVPSLPASVWSVFVVLGRGPGGTAITEGTAARAGRCRSPSRPACRCSAPCRSLPAVSRRGRASDCRGGASRTGPGRRCSAHRPGALGRCGVLRLLNARSRRGP